MSREDFDFIMRIEDAKVSVAKTALSMPFMFRQGSELHTARQELAKAMGRLQAAQAAWDDLISPAKGWAPDPLKEPK